ncbi:MAG: 16S rRNA (cytidine(1402)-2'-O)-methyltransferase [Candidatus Omnitrophica bacterium]|nr:16S rRNA (cytidine(1402)-2'-O)-methyltransferase [Candidatus Omnitrophota bacterium]
MGTLYIIATPIGNLEDITLRALRLLKEVDLILSEDTRYTRKLLAHYGIHTPRMSFHEHSGGTKAAKVIELLKSGKNAALVSDSGTPLISDPGYPLIQEAIKEGIQVEPVPGPSAVTAAVAASGFRGDKFVFCGFLSAKPSRRAKELEALKEEEKTLVFFESPHRILSTLELARGILGDRKACVARELTKKFEEVLRGSLSELESELKKRKKIGELVLIVEGQCPVGD